MNFRTPTPLGWYFDGFAAARHRNTREPGALPAGHQQRPAAAAHRNTREPTGGGAGEREPPRARRAGLVSPREGDHGGRHQRATTAR